jgi:hypothetical protein
VPKIRLLLIAALVGLTSCDPRARAGAAAAGSGAAAAGSGAAVAAAESAPAFKCAAGVLTCIRVLNRTGKAQTDIPVTFGQPFAPGDMPSGATLTARTASGATLPVQIDEPATNSDGSLRYAVASLVLPQLPGDGAVVSLFVEKSAAPASSAGGTPAAAAAAYLDSGHDLDVVLNLYSAQISQIFLGDRDGFKPGTPFQAGDVITVEIGDDPADKYELTVTEQTAGGTFGNYKKLAEALTALINKSQHYRAYKIGEGGGYERLWLTAREGAGKPFDVRVSTTSQAPVKTWVIQPYEAPRRYVASTRGLLTEAQRKGDLKTWLAGAVATEFTLSGPFAAEEGGAPHPRINARLDVRFYPAAAKRVRTDVTVEDAWAYDPGPRNWQYDVDVVQGGKTLFAEKGVAHNHHARWHRVFWSDPDPGIMVQHDLGYLLQSRAVLNYDRSLQIPEAILAQEERNLAKADTSVMGPAFIVPYFGMTGGRADIGPLPRWTVLYLLTEDPRSYAAMMANADAAGAIPIHYRDRKTDLPVSIDAHPTAVIVSGTPKPEDVFPKLTNSDTIWQPEPAHQPSLDYVPYLLTGDRFYLDELQFWADWNLIQMNPGARKFDKGILAEQQIRGYAWSLRTLGHAAWVTPDKHPMKKYFEAKLANNLDWQLERYAKRTHPLGFDAIRDNMEKMITWQLDFLVLTVGELAEKGYPAAEKWLRWLAEPAVGLWNNEQNGFCRMLAPTQDVWMRPKSGGENYKNWQEIVAGNFPDLNGECPTVFPKNAYDGSALGYITNAMAAMAVLSDLNVSGSRETYDWIAARQTKVPFYKDPTWKIMPR